MTRAIDIPGYRDAHNEVDARLNDTLGLAFALDQMVILHPELSKANDMQSQSISALINAIRENTLAAQSFQVVAWEFLGGRVSLAPEAA